jgi:hypothetical protein
MGERILPSECQQAASVSFAKDLRRFQEIFERSVFEICAASICNLVPCVRAERPFIARAGPMQALSTARW